MVPQVVAVALRKVGVCSECGKHIHSPGSSPDKASILGDRNSSQRVPSPGASSPGHYRHSPHMQPFSHQPTPVPMSSAPQRHNNGHAHHGANGVTPPMSVPGHMHGATHARMQPRQDDVMATGGAANSLPNDVGALRDQEPRDSSMDMHGGSADNGSDVVMFVPEQSSGQSSSSLRAGREWLSAKAESLFAGGSKGTGNSSKGTLRSSGRSDRHLFARASAAVDAQNNGAQSDPLDVRSGEVVSPHRAAEDAQQRAHNRHGAHVAHASHAQIPNSVRSELTKDRGVMKASPPGPAGPPNVNVRTVRSSGTQSSGGEVSQKLPEPLQDLRDPPSHPGSHPAVRGGTGPTYVRSCPLYVICSVDGIAWGWSSVYRSSLVAYRACFACSAAVGCVPQLMCHAHLLPVRFLALTPVSACVLR